MSNGTSQYMRAREREREKQSQSCHLAAEEHEGMHNHTPHKISIFFAFKVRKNFNFILKNWLNLIFINKNEVLTRLRERIVITDSMNFVAALNY